MASTTTTVLGPIETTHSVAQPPKRSRYAWTLLLLLLTAATLLVDGYHPLAEDGGLYVAGVEYRLNPTLFPHDTAFVTAHLHYSIFAPAIASVVHLTHMPLAWTLLYAYIFSLWLLLFAGLQLIRRCTTNSAAQLAGVALLGAWSSLPVAGTSLLLIDPYLTARSFTTPLSLLAIAYALDDWQTSRLTLPRPACLCALSLVLAGLLHPLMAFCALTIVILLRLLRHSHPQRLIIAFTTLAVTAASSIHTLAPPDPPAVIAASLSRYYWFLSQWQWYEVFGLFGPFAILLLLLRWHRKPNGSACAHNIRIICKAGLVAGSIAITIALLFAHERSSTYLIARLQPLRVFLLLYALMTLLLGAILTDRLFTASLKKLTLLVPGIIILTSGFTLFTVQRETFPASRHIEFPWSVPTNPWSQAFLWARDNTAPQTLFALDPDYITTPGEDAQTFRATAQRSALPDFSKDGGEASITPSLAMLWQRSLTAQFAVQSGTALTSHSMLSSQTDAERDAHLGPLGVNWLILHADSRTSHLCPYNNGTVKICSLAP